MKLLVIYNSYISRVLRGRQMLQDLRANLTGVGWGTLAAAHGGNAPV